MWYNMAVNMGISSTTTAYKSLQNPIQCLYWNNASAIKEGALREKFELVETCVKDDQFWQYLLRCRECGQLYFMEFREETDWVGGNDPQYTTYVPVRNRKEGDVVQEEGCKNVVPRLHADFPSNVTSSIFYWVAEATKQ